MILERDNAITSLDELRADATAVKSQVTQVDSDSELDGNQDTVDDKEARQRMPATDGDDRVQSTDTNDEKETRKHKAAVMAMLASKSVEVTLAIDEAVQKIEYLAEYVKGIKDETMRIVDLKTDCTMRALEGSIEKIRSMRNDVERAKDRVVEMTEIIQMKAITLSNQAFEKYGFDDPLTARSRFEVRNEPAPETLSARNHGSVSASHTVSTAITNDERATVTTNDERATVTTQHDSYSESVGSIADSDSEQQDESIIALDAQWEHMLADIIKAQEDAMMTAENTLTALSQIMQVCHMMCQVCAYIHNVEFA